jgi:hypothetical protein
MGALVLCLLIACKSGEGSTAQPDPNALKAQQEMLAKRDSLLAQRQKLKEQKQKLEGDLKVAQDGHTDTVEIQKQLDSVNLQIDNSANETFQLLASKLDTAIGGGDKAAQVAAREARVAEREAAVTTREKDQDKRFSAELSALKDTVNAKCGGETIVQQITAPPPTGHSNTKKDVDDRLKHARDVMFKHGILNGDLPGPVQGLESEATDAMSKNDLSKAFALANQLALQVDAIQINGAFIRAKISRLQAQIKATKPDEGTQTELAGALTDVMNFFGNAKYEQANQRLNQLASKLH